MSGAVLLVLLLEPLEDLGDVGAMLGVFGPAPLHQLQVGRRHALLWDRRPLTFLHHGEEDLAYCHPVKRHLRSKRTGTWTTWGPQVGKPPLQRCDGRLSRCHVAQSMNCMLKCCNE